MRSDITIGEELSFSETEVKFQDQPTNRASTNRRLKQLGRFLYLFTLSILFHNCQSPACSNREVNVSPQYTSAENLRYSPSSLKSNYIWCNNFDSSQTIFSRINPPAYTEIYTYDTISFASWLKHLPLLPSGSPVKDYSGEKIPNQNNHFAVMNMDVGEKNLQQCADAAIRLRAEYLFATHQINQICFSYTNGEPIPFNKWRKGWRPAVKNNKTTWNLSATPDSSYTSFRNYLMNVFNYAGSASLAKEMVRVSSFDSIRAGDVLVKGGNPGHVMTIVEIAINKKTGKKYFLLSQSFMPAQSIHIVKNYSRPDISPWYDTDDERINTPGWQFEKKHLMRWK